VWSIKSKAKGEYDEFCRIFEAVVCVLNSISITLSKFDNYV